MIHNEERAIFADHKYLNTQTRKEGKKKKEIARASEKAFLIESAVYNLKSVLYFLACNELY